MTPVRPFNIRLWFAVAGLGVILSMGLAFAVLISDFVTTRMLRREAEVTREFLESVIRAEQSAARVFAGGDPAANPPLASFIGHLRSMPDVLRANIYGRDRRILWSTEPELIDRVFEANEELDTAFEGTLVTEIGTLGGDHKAEHVALDADASGHFIEVYIPIGEEGRILGVVELYKVPAALEVTIREGQRMIWAAAALGTLGLFGTLYWIVRRGAAQIERQQAEIASMEALAALGQMASAVAHSLRNPLANIRSSAELMRLDLQEPGAVSTEIIGEVDRLDGCVRELLNYTRAEPAAPQSINPLDLLAACIRQQSAYLQRIGVVATIEDQRRAGGAINVDPALFGQAVASIVTNAAEAMPEGGDLTIRLTEDPSASITRIVIADTGQGIPAGTLHRIWEPFYTTKTRGLGLGLALARRIIERFGGRLLIESTLGAGTRVNIELPVR